MFGKSAPFHWLVHICESDSSPCQGGQELGKSLEANRHSPGLTSGFALGSGRRFATGYDSLHSLDICSLCLLASCFLPTGSSLGGISGQGLAWQAHHETQMFWGGNALGDHFPPVTGGEVKTSATHPPAGWFWEPSVGFSGSPRRIPPFARDADLDYVYLHWPLHLLCLILSLHPWGQLPNETIYTLVLVSGSVLWIHCLIQSTSVLLPLGQCLDLTGHSLVGASNSVGHWVDAFTSTGAGMGIRSVCPLGPRLGPRPWTQPALFGGTGYEGGLQVRTNRTGTELAT